MSPAELILWAVLSWSPLTFQTLRIMSLIFVLTMFGSILELWTIQTLISGYLGSVRGGRLMA